MLVSGSREWVDQQLLAILPDIDSSLCLSAKPVNSFKTIKPEHINGLLGMEFDLIVFDAFDQFDADHFAIAEGLLKGGGLLFLLIQTPDVWVQSSCFRQRFIRLIKSTSDWSFISEEAENHIAPEPVNIQPINKTDDVLAQQQIAIQAVMHVVNGHRNRPLVIVANRGRGKSAAMGIASAHLLQQKDIHIIVTAPAKSAVDILFKHCRIQLGVTDNNHYKIIYEKSSIEFIAPDALISKPVQAGLLLVDEAAAIPVPMLEKLMHRYHRLVLSSTAYGYEGSGQGFEKRFIPRLLACYPQSQQIHLQHPIRWKDHDPFEAFCYQAFLLDSDDTNIELEDSISFDDLELRKIDQSGFIQDDTELSCVYGLLRSAHYRTHPDDLQQIMDDPALSVFGLFLKDQIVATAIVINETLPEEAPEDSILNGKRRLKGYHLPQTIIMEHGLTDIHEYKFTRIMRIAVHPQLQHIGLGSYLLGDIEKILDADFIGASFGVSEHLLGFWQKAGFHVIKTGQKINARSGNHSVVMIKPCTKKSSALINIIRNQYTENLLFQLDDNLKLLDSHLALALLWHNSDLIHISYHQNDSIRLKAFAQGNYTFKAASDAIYRLVLVSIKEGRISHLNPEFFIVLIERIIQKLTDVDIVSRHGLKGKQDLDKLLRTVVGKLLVK